MDVKLSNGMLMPNLGQGSWLIGEDKTKEEKEIESMRMGIEKGLTLIDTAEVYGDGGSEELIGKAIEGVDREKLFIVSKVAPFNGAKGDMERSLNASLKRLGTSYLDMYLIHWIEPDSPSLEEMVEQLEGFVKDGRIKCWGVSNFDVEDMERLWNIPGGSNCVVNQIQYNIAARGSEYALQPWLKEHGVKMMVYAPMIHGEEFRKKVLADEELKKIADKNNMTVFELLLAFATKNKDDIVIFKAGNPIHVDSNINAANMQLSDEDLKAINELYPAPDTKIPLEII